MQAAILLCILCGCADAPERLWTSDSERLEYTLRGAFGGTVCEAAFDRSELSDEQLARLGALDFVEGEEDGGCDPQTYWIVVRYKNGTTRQALSAPQDCATEPWVIPYDDFNAVARSLVVDELPTCPEH